MLRIFAERGRTFHSCTSQNITSLLIYCIWNCILSEQVLPLRNMHVYNIKKHACVQYECNAMLALFLFYEYCEFRHSTCFILLASHLLYRWMYAFSDTWLVSEANSWLKAKKNHNRFLSYWQKSIQKYCVESELYRKSIQVNLTPFMHSWGSDTIVISFHPMTKKYENDIDEGQKMILRNSWNIK